MKRVFIPLLIITAFSVLNAADVPLYRDALKLTIHADQERYFSDESPRVYMKLTNTSYKSVEFTLYDKDGALYPFVSFLPFLFDMRGRELEPAVEWRQEHRELEKEREGCAKRILTLGPGESFTYTANLGELYRLQSGTYRIRGFFVPEDNESTLRSLNEITITVDEYSPVPERSEDKARQFLEPTEIVMLALSAEREGNWDRYLKFFDIEKYIFSYTEYIDPFTRAYGMEKEKVKEDFRRFLQRRRYDYLIDFTILEQKIQPGNEEATVIAEVTRYSPRLPDRYRYFFTLEKSSDRWIITGLDASIMQSIQRKKP